MKTMKIEDLLITLDAELIPCKEIEIHRARNDGESEHLPKRVEGGWEVYPVIIESVTYGSVFKGSDNVKCVRFKTKLPNKRR